MTCAASADTPSTLRPGFPFRAQAGKVGPELDSWRAAQAAAFNPPPSDAPPCLPTRSRSTTT
ncbi:MAG: hypothetical protein KA128_00480, partial [Zoogloea sp.]|nr:hypothetical protein [Zoogloea sp.]